MNGLFNNHLCKYRSSKVMWLLLSTVRYWGPWQYISQNQTLTWDICFTTTIYLLQYIVKMCTKEKCAYTSKWKAVRGVTRHWYLLVCFVYLEILAEAAKKRTETISIYTFSSLNFSVWGRASGICCVFTGHFLTIQNKMWSALNRGVVLITSPRLFPSSRFDLPVIRLV